MMSDSKENLPLGQSWAPHLQSSSGKRPVVVGLYGLPGSGKTSLLSELALEIDHKHFHFYEGSKLIDSIVPGGLQAFEGMQEKEKEHWRQGAISSVERDCINSGKVAVVTGHFMFWTEKQAVGHPVYTPRDLEIFTHILYLDVPAEALSQRRQSDTQRSRPPASAAHLQRWQEAEKTQLRDICLQYGILFFIAPTDPVLLSKISALLRDFRDHSEEFNSSNAKRRLDEIVTAQQGQLEAVLLLDADRTLAAEDTGTLFWEAAARKCPTMDIQHSLKRLFGSSLGHSYTAFRQAALYYEEMANKEMFDDICQTVVSAVSLHPDFVSLLQLVAEQKHVRAIVVTCGLRVIWEEVLKREGISENVRVIGGGLLADGLVITPTSKGALVSHLQVFHRLKVWAFGDSPLDLDMLVRADRAIVVVGEEQSRSKSMDAALAKAIDSGGLQARQVVLPSHASRRLDVTKLPVTKLTEPEFVESLFGRYTSSGLQIHCATNKTAAKVLATRMRDASVAGPSLREAHHHAGWYLAIEYLTELIGLEQSSIRHVLGRQTKGYQLLHEKRTTIVALMRGGEPMALGVNDALPKAMLVHAHHPDSIKLHHLSGQLSVILVDSVLNTGKTIVDCVQHIRKLHSTIRIVIIAGVVQAECISENGLRRKLANHANLHLIALRHSDTKFTGSGNTDTGNRLFNTTHLL